MRTFYFIPVITLAFALCQSSAQAIVSPIPPGVFDINAQVNVVSNYVWRGVSQSNNDPSINGGVTFTHKETNLYGQLEAATITRTDRHTDNAPTEILTGLGMKGPLFAATYDLHYLSYYYPDAYGIGWNEFLTSIQYDWFDAGLTFSSNALNSDSTGWYAYVNSKWQIPQNTYFTASPDCYIIGKVGRFIFNRGNNAALDYTDYLLGLEKHFDKQFTASGILTATNRNFQGGSLDQMHLLFKLGVVF